MLVAGVAGLGGCISPAPGTKNPVSKALPPEMTAKETSGPVKTAGGMRSVSDSKRDAAVYQAQALGVNKVTSGSMNDPNLKLTNGFSRVTGSGAGMPPGGPTDNYPPEVYGPMQRGISTAFGHGGILPAPPMGPYGAVALVPGAAGGPGMGGMGGMYANGRTSINFVSPAGMTIGFQDARGFSDVLMTGTNYNFLQGNIYRLRISKIPNRPGRPYYPTLEVYPAAKETIAFLSHSSVPIGFSDEDMEQVKNGNLLVKVIYLPSAQFQDVAAAEEIVSTKLEPGADPVAEASRRGTILAVIRLGNIDLENPNTPAMDAGPGSAPSPKMMPGPGLLVPPSPMPPKISGIESGKGEMISMPTKGTPSDLPLIVLPTKK